MSERQKAKVINCALSQFFHVTEDKDNDLTPDTVFVDGENENKSFLTREDCEKYKQAGDPSQDAYIHAVTKKQPFLRFWTRTVPVAKCSVHSCLACKENS